MVDVRLSPLGVGSMLALMALSCAHQRVVGVQRFIFLMLLVSR
jgi:hypothetical protein